MFRYNDVGSRSFSGVGKDKGGSITINQVYFSSTDRMWDIHIWVDTDVNMLPTIIAFAEKVDAVLVGRSERDKSKPAEPSAPAGADKPHR